MKKIEIIKKTVGLITAIGIGVIVGNAIRLTTPSGTGKIMRVIIGLSGGILAGILSDEAEKFINLQVDKLVETTKTLASETEE